MSRARFKSWFGPPLIFPSAGWGFALSIAALWFSFGCATSLRAQDVPGNGAMALSESGQFVVTGSDVRSPLLSLPEVATNGAFAVLQPALLAISAERIKQSLYRLLALPAEGPWKGKIYLSLHPALVTDEEVTVVSRPGEGGWSYLVELPDVVQRARFMRGMVGALLLELAQRNAGPAGHAAEIPPWLIEGLSRHLSQDELAQVVLSAPDQPLGSQGPREAARRERDLDALAQARWVLRKYPALTFDQLSWPTAAQLAGDDAGVYAASAQLFVSAWLGVNGGAAQIRAMLADLPKCYNWQTAFQNACRARFCQPVDVEKWWALEVVDFVSHDPGPAWTPAFSAARLEELLVVLVDERMSSNALPSHVEIPFQAVLRLFDPEQQRTIFETRLRDLRIAELRMAPQFIGLTDDYCRVLAGFLGERLTPAPRSPSYHRPVAAPARWSAGAVLKRLDALDSRRRALEASLRPRSLQTSARPGAPPAGMADLKAMIATS